MKTNIIHVGDNVDNLKVLPESSVDMCIAAQTCLLFWVPMSMGISVAEKCGHYATIEVTSLSMYNLWIPNFQSQPSERTRKERSTSSHLMEIYSGWK